MERLAKAVAEHEVDEIEESGTDAAATEGSTAESKAAEVQVGKMLLASTHACA